MTSSSRRTFLQSVAAAGTLGAFPPVIQRALAAPAKVVTGTIKDVQHVVILTQENRSFDHYFGTLAGVRGFGDPFPLPVVDRPGLIQGRSVWVQPTEPTNATSNPAVPGRTQPKILAPFRLNTKLNFNLMRVDGTPHGWGDRHWDQGRMNWWPLTKHNHSMGYYGAEDIPFQFALANAFTICDAYHCSLAGSTNPNRLFIWTGTNDPLGRSGGPAVSNRNDWFDNLPDYTWTTYAERLQAAGISWQVYQNMDDNFTDNPLAGFRPFRDGWFNRAGASAALKARGITTRDLDLLRQDVVNGTLPQVSWIVANEEGSEHPGPSSPAQGADYTARVLEALTANPEVWASTVLLVNFDENDGFFDHVPPPAAPSVVRWSDDPAQRQLAGASTVDTSGEYHEVENPLSPAPDTLHWPYGLGPRVPMYVVSPFSKGGWVNSQVFDHTSVLRFLEQRFGVMEPNISPWRRAVCGDLTSAFNFANPNHSTDFLRQLPDTRTLADRTRALGNPTKPRPTLPATLSLPVQASGVRPSSALPYELAATASVAASRVTVAFVNTGSAAAVFHVYDRLRLADVPRRYTVEPGKQLQGQWLPDGRGAYDLWILGPNGFHRHITGNAGLLAMAGAANPEVQVSADRSSGDLLVKLLNGGGAACEFQLAANRYGSGQPGRYTVVARGEQALRLPLAASGRWYDFSVTATGLAGFSRRFAGRVETGAPSISDPAMGGQALADQWVV
ncbi:phosphocholine-specific phospholipase C [Roseateles cellulosilyticus]|uniref:phospholipase C n=1 Tax=Pelomonas cellulosilytica TaxID=2906762 RepID=A0ABS8XPH2_9BURK|nr:phospholipase C, phosphocholine-specific [Pelomonas sp. P8]MCE4553640.1 phospholipase C, phosphocholine-specific [Pelomonas sp. P8]